LSALNQLNTTDGLQIFMIDPDILIAAVQRNVTEALNEDVGSGDLSAQLIDPEHQATARVITRQAGIFCGKPWAEETIRQVNEQIVIDWQVTDGDQVAADQTLFNLLGPAAALLSAERTLLNFAQLLSGTATKTAHYVALIAPYNTVLLDTRKTIPGLRVAQKYAVSCGGGQNHRMGLFDAYLLKENHIAAAGSIAAAVTAARRAHPDIPLEVEAENLDELRQIIEAGADIAMIDNFSLQDSAAAVAMAKGRTALEASGGITEKSITDIAATGVDYVSIGELTKNIDPLDLSMRFL
jgi:nicotinate-nucleotide pyrophosphorylase (carboxylating)